MKSSLFFATTAVLLALGTVPASAGEADRARAAIAEARGKITAGDKVGASSGAPMLQTEARAALGDAEVLLARGKKTESLAAARRAGELADVAIVNADRAKMSTVRDARADAEAATVNARDAAANAQAATIAADTRADAAERAADNANARADLMAATPMVAPAPAATTTVAIEEKTVTRAPVKRAAPRKKVAVRRTVPAASRTATKTTTTTVTTRPN
jgi:hypothetical protein